MSITNPELERLARVVRGAHSADLSNAANEELRQYLRTEIADALNLTGVKRQSFIGACVNPMYRIGGR